MYQLISKVNDIVNLQQRIDNINGMKRVGLRSFTYALEWYNVLAHFEHPEYKLLTSNAITELTLDVRDENNILIDNHSLPINAVLGKNFYKNDEHI